jgi:hypothetical protein
MPKLYRKYLRCEGRYKQKHILWGLCIAVFLFPDVCLALAPHQVGGFTLGTNITDYKDRVKMETALPIRYNTFLNEVEIKPQEGFKSGLIAYGTCAEPGRIVRIKLKYADSSKQFYETLFMHFKNKFGEPVEYRGDSFQVVIAWKWSFVDKNYNRISLTLLHNRLDEEAKMGNSVKLTLLNIIAKERRCFEKKQPGSQKKPPQKTVRPPNWEMFIPR